jgi:hypothetical protein
MLGKIGKAFGMLSLLALVAVLPRETSAQQFVTVLPPPPSYAEVTVGTLNVRGEPIKDGTLVSQLQKGDLIPVKKTKEGWAQLAWNGKAYVFEQGIQMPEGDINKKPRYEDMREAFINRMRGMDKTIQWLEVPRESGITVRFHWREYKDKAALIKRCEELARIYSTMSTGEKGITVDIVNGNELWARAFY